MEIASPNANITAANDVKTTKDKDNNVMNDEHTSIDATIIDHFMRKAHIERSLAVAAMTRQAIDSVRKIFTDAGAGEAAAGRC